MDQQTQFPDSSATGNTGERYQRLSHFLLAIILRLEGVERRQALKKEVDGIALEESQDQTDSAKTEETLSSCESTSTPSVIVSPSQSQQTPSPIYSTPQTSKKSSLASSISKSSQQSDNLPVKSELQIEKPTSPTIVDDDVNVEEVQQKRGFCPCPCQLFFTPTAVINRQAKLKSGKLLMTMSGNDSYPDGHHFYTPKIAPIKFGIGVTDKIEEGINSAEDQDLLGMPSVAEWKHQLNHSLLAEASNLYREALLKAESARFVEGIIFQALAKIVVESVLDNARDVLNRKTARTRGGLSGNTKMRRELKVQKPKVTFDVNELDGKSEEREFVAPRGSTPYRHVQEKRVNSPAKLVRMLMEESLDEHPVLALDPKEGAKPNTTVDKSSLNLKAKRENKENGAASIHEEIIRKIHRDSPPVPFKLRTSKPIYNRLLRKVVEKHFGDECLEHDDSTLDESITATGDAKKDTPDEKSDTICSSVSTQTEEEMDASIQATQTDSSVENETDVAATERIVQTESLPFPVIDLKSEVRSEDGVPLLGDDDIEESRSHTLESDKQSSEIENKKAPAFLKLKTTIPQTSPLLRNVVEKHTSAADMKDTAFEDTDIVRGAEDYRQEADSLNQRDVRRAISIRLVDRIMQQALYEVASQQAEPFGVLFDRNTPNIPDSAKQSLNIVTPTSGSDMEFCWSSSAFERAAASLAETAGKSKFSWTPYLEEEALGPSRTSVTHQHVDYTCMTSTIKVEKTGEEDVYLSAESGGSDDEYVDAQSYSSDGAQLTEDEVTALVHDAITEAIALTITKGVIRRSLERMDEESICVSRQPAFKPRSEDGEVKTHEDHTYAKINVGAARDSATTIETISDSHGDSGFSDTQSSLSDIQIMTSDEDDKVIREIVNAIMKRAVNMVVDDVTKDWGESLELEEIDKFATPEELSEAESGISAASSYHSVASDVTSSTLLRSDENAPTPTPDTLAFLKDQLVDVKALIEKYQEMSRTEDTSVAPTGHLKTEKMAANTPSARVRTREKRKTSDEQSLQDDTKETIKVQASKEQVNQGAAEKHDVIDQATKVRNIVSKSTSSSETTTNTESMTLSSVSTSADSHGSLNKSQKSPNAGRVRKRSRVTTHIFFWEKIGKHKKGSKNRERPVKPETPTKETGGKFERIARESSSSSLSCSAKEIGDDVKKTGMQRRHSNKGRRKTWAGTRQPFWKNSAFFEALEEPERGDDSQQKIESQSDSELETGHVECVAALEKPARGDDYQQKIESQSDSELETGYVECVAALEEPAREDDSQLKIKSQSDSELETGYVERGVRVNNDGKHEQDEQGQSEDISIVNNYIAASEDHVDRPTSDDLPNDEEQTFKIEATPDNALELEIPAKLSKSEEEMKLWLEKCKQVKERTAMLLSRCAEGQTLRGLAEAVNNGIIRTVKSDPSVVSSHDTGDGIFPFGAHAVVGPHPDMFNPDAHVAALEEEEEDWIGSSADTLAIEAIMKENDKTSFNMDEFRVKQNEDAVRGNTVDRSSDPDANLTPLEGKGDGIARSEDLLATRIETITKESDETLKQDEDAEHVKVVDLASGETILTTEESCENATPIDSESFDNQDQYTTYDIVCETTADVSITPLPIKKKGKKFNIFKIFKSKKSRRMSGKRNSGESKGSSTSSCLSRASEVTLHGYSPAEGPSESSWNPSMVILPTDSGARLTNFSAESSTDDPSALSSTSHDSSASRNAKRPFRKRLFHFKGLKKSKKSSSHTSDSKKS